MATSPNYGWLEPDNTDLVKNGALAIRTLGNAIDTTMATMTPKSLVDAKGDLIAASANDTPARLAVGNNGETLVADSSTSTGLRYNANYAAGLNKLINSDFSIWQRGTSTSAGSSTHTFVSDRWQCFQNGSGSCTVAQQSFTVGQTDVPNNPTYFIRVTGGTGTSYVSDLVQYVENVSTFASQTVTISFYAKASSSQTIGVILGQNFGSGGSTQVDTSVTLSASTLTTSWVRYTGTVTLPSISGKTVGTGNYLGVRIRNSSTSNGTTWDLSNVKIEAGSVATAFQTATGTIQGELAACQRYFQSLNGSLAISGATGIVMANYYRHQTQMRVAPTITVTTAPSYTNASGLTNDENSVTGSRFYATLTSSAGGGGFATGFIYSASAEL